MEQIPDRLTDPKTKMQERHLDMLVNKDVTDVLRLRAEVLRFMREHFYSKRFLEFQTPILAENAGGAIARPFVTRASEFRNKDLALRVAPELWLKRLVVGGVDRVFEIGPSFRNEGIDATHNPEFTMCEFYSAYSNLADLIKETEELICGLAERSSELIKSQLTSLPPIDLDHFKRPFKQVQFIPGLEKALGFRFPKLSSEDALPELLAILKLSGISLPGEVPTSLPKLLDRLAAVYLEPMSFHEPLFITHHPSCMSPLSKSFLCPNTLQLVSARAELFIGGRELANMYEEENDPVEQKRKLVDHRNLVNTPGGGIAVIDPGETGKEEDTPSSPLLTDAPVMDDSTLSPPLDTEAPILDDSTLPPPLGVDGPVDDGREPSSRLETDADGETSPLDQSFIKALDYALPPTGGWGCGVERLVMLFSGANRISDCLSFGSLRNVVGLTAAEKANDVTKPWGKRDETRPDSGDGAGEKASGSRRSED
jgi:lysyl-tRNA synthetase class 2